jgi:hypothetical protein
MMCSSAKTKVTTTSATALVRWYSPLRHSLRRACANAAACLQEPVFETKAVGSAMRVEAKKTAADASYTSEALFIASNVNNPGGIGAKWHEGGLSAQSRVSCTDGPSGPPQCDANADCSTIWVQPSTNCSVLNASHVTTDVTNGVTIDASAATITFRVWPRELPKGEYGFTVFLPARNRTSWSFFPIGGMLTVVAVPDAALSTFTACQRLPNSSKQCTASSTAATAESLVFTSVHSTVAAVIISVSAVDISRIPIQEAGETITVRVSRAGAKAGSTVPANFDVALKQYQASIIDYAAFEGDYTVVLETALPTPSPQSLQFKVRCAAGYIANKTTGACEASNRCGDSDQYTEAQTLICKRKPAMGVSGSSTTLSIQVRKKRKSSTAVGTAEVRLTSGDVDRDSPVKWTAALAHHATWLSCTPLEGEVSGQSPISKLQLTVDASNLSDTRGLSSLKAEVTVASKIGSMSTDGSVSFVGRTDELRLPVSVAVVAVAYLDEADVTISSKADGKPVSRARVPIDSSLIVTVQARDCDRLVIDRPDQQVKLVLTSPLGGYAPRNITLLYKECEGCVGLFEAEIPATALGDPAVYQLTIGAEESAVTLSITTFDSNGAQVVQGAVVGSVVACIIMGMLFTMYRNPKKARQLLLSFLNREFKMVLTTTSEVWDIVGTCTLQLRACRPCECVLQGRKGASS